MAPLDSRVLILGYGNPGRLDDGLGPAAAGRIASLGHLGVTVDSDYQLQVEDAAAIARHDVVVFVDAATRGARPFFLRRIHPKADLSFTSHSVTPSALLAMARDHFGVAVEGYALGILGRDFEGFGEGLSGPAEEHLAAAVEYLDSALHRRTFDPTEADSFREAFRARSA